jgi:hypothetical protein
LIDRQLAVKRDGFDRAWRQLLATPGGAIRLRIDRDDIGTRPIQQGAKVGARKLGSPREYKPQA